MATAASKMSEVEKISERRARVEAEYRGGGSSSNSGDLFESSGSFSRFCARSFRRRYRVRWGDIGRMSKQWTVK
eukprot:6733496-Pyramimonas_sp.AAC.1